MNLFQSSGSSNNNYSMPFGNQPANPFNRTNTNTNLNNSFGPSSSLSGPNSLFPPSGSNNLFSTNNTNTNMNTGNTGGNMWGNSGNQTSNNLFRSNTGGQSMFPTGGNSSSLFQTNNSNSGFPRSNSMLNSGGPSFLNNSNTNNNTPNFQSNLFNSSSSHNYGTRSNDLSSFYEKGSVNYKFNPQKNNDGLYIYSITNSKGYNKKSLDEIRMEDYAFIKSGQVPDNIKKAIENNIQGLQGGNSMGMGSGVMIGSSSNNLFNTGSGGMGGMNSNMGMNNNSMGSNNLFASNSNNNNMNRNSMWPGAGNNSNNLFQSNNSMNNPFGQQGMGNNQGGNNLFSQGGGGGGSGSGPNFFNNNQSGNNFMNNNNNQQNSSNNLFSNQNRFQNQSSVFPQQNNMGMGMQSGNNPFPGSMSNSGNNLFQNRQNSGFPQNTGTTNNNLFGNRAAPPSLFPNQQNQMPNSLFPNQGGQQMGFLSQNPGAPQLGNNPHLFPPQNNFPGAFPGYPQQPYPQYPGYNPQGGFPTMDMSGNPHLFPPQGQNPYQQTQFQAYMAMQNTNDPYNSQYQNSSIFSPGPEDRRTYAPRQTLTDAIMNLDNKRKEEGKSSPRGGFTYFPYNPFEKKGRKMDVNDKENLKNISLLRPSQMTKRHDDEDAFTLIKKSKIVEDDVEIVMRPRLFLPTRGRNRSFSPMSTTRSRDNSAEYYARAGGKNIYNNSVKVSVNVSLGGYNENMEVRLFRQATIDDLKVKVLERLRDKGGFLRPESTVSLENLAMKCELFYDSRVVHGSKTLDQANMVDGSNVYLQIDEEHVSEELFEENKRKRQQEVSQAGSSYIGMNGYERGSQMSRYVPKLTKEGYYTVPAIDELARMPETELAMIEGFTVGNEWGKIEFEGRTDVRGLDLDDLVEIKHKAVEVYPEERYPTDASKPIRGEKLNKPAIVTLYKCFFTGKTKGPAFKKSLQERSQRDNNEFIDYDDENGVYKIRVKYF